MVMDRLGTDLQKVFMENGGQVKKPSVLQLGVLMVRHFALASVIIYILLFLMFVFSCNFHFSNFSTSA